MHFTVVSCELVQLCFLHAQAVLEPQDKLVLVNFRKLLFHFLHFLTQLDPPHRDPLLPGATTSLGQLIQLAALLQGSLASLDVLV